MGDHNNHMKKRCIDEIIEQMASDIKNNDGQYIPLHFTQSPTHTSSHIWSECNPTSSGNVQHPYLTNLGENQLFIPDIPLRYDVKPAHIQRKPGDNPQHHIFYATTRQQQLNAIAENRDVIGTLVDSGGNIVNVVYGASQNSPNASTMAYHMIPRDGSGEPMQHSLGGFMPYQQTGMVDNAAKQMRDYGLFGNDDISQRTSHQLLQQQPKQHYHGNITVNNRAQLIENLVGNWVPNQSGTYSPFGCVDDSSRAVPLADRQGLQTGAMPAEMDCGFKGLSPGLKKTRIVAEVRPMRPSYSDVLAKSAPSPSPVTTGPMQKQAPNVLSKAEIGGKKCNQGSKGGGGKKNKGLSLKRQHSSGSDEQNGTHGKVAPSPGMARKWTEVAEPRHVASPGQMPRKWVSLDNLETEKQVSDEATRQQVAEPAKQPAVSQASRKSKTRNEEKWDNVGATLNNRKPTALTSSNKGCADGGGGTKRPPIHINNNLGTSSWAPNIPTTGPPSSDKNTLKGSSKNCKTSSDDKKANTNNSSLAGNKSETKVNSTSCSRGPSRSTSTSTDKPPKRNQRNKKKESHSSMGWICRPVEKFVSRWSDVILRVMVWFIHLLSDVLGMSFRLLAHLCAFSYDRLCVWTARCWRKLGILLLNIKFLEYLGLRPGVDDGKSHKWWQFWWFRASSKGSDKTPPGSGEDGPRLKEGFPQGLESNISLPATGDEAMKRLLACKGKDPYSILGVTPHCCDDDIKKYYKRQAFLVHPDKNNQPGAEEAFKILVHAFELIGEPERRKAYDRRVTETQQVEQAWSELSDLLSQLHQKMEYAANTIRCTNCNKRHRRINVERPCYAARLCSQCKIHHSAREGDIWAESSMMGFLWHYYACMDGAVYDITEWAACQADNLRHLRANTHNVQYRIVLGKQQQPSAAHARSHARGTHEANGEPDLEEFLNNLYNQSGETNRGHTEQGRSRKKGKRKK